MRWLRMGFASSSGLEMPMPMTSRSSVSASFCVNWRFAVFTAAFSRLGGKWDIQLVQKSNILPLEGRLWA